MPKPTPKNSSSSNSNRPSQWQRWRKSTPKSRIAADKAMIDAIRELFKMVPLYDSDPLCSDRKVGERFERPIYTEIRGRGMRTRYELS